METLINGESYFDHRTKINNNFTDLYNNKDYAEFHIENPVENLALNNDGVTWTKIPMMNIALNNGFEVVDNTLIKITRSGRFLVTGTSDLSVAVASGCRIFYGISLNGDIVEHEVTPHDFGAVDKTENISITAIVYLNIDDEIEIMAKGDGTTGIELTINKLDVTFWS